MVSGRSLLMWTSALAAIVLTTSATPATVTSYRFHIAPAYLNTNGTTAPFQECAQAGTGLSCGVLLVINPDGSITVSPDKDHKTFDAGGDDTLVGVLNQSSFPIPSLTLTSNDTDNAFGFDQDGICPEGHRAPSCQADASATTGYEGPDNTFTVQDDNHGTVNFRDGGIPPGQSTYFALEGSVADESIQFPTTLTYVGQTTGDFNDPAILAARLTGGDNGAPIAGQEINLKLDGRESCTATTDSNGVGQCSVTPTEAAGTVPVSASFAGAGPLLARSTTASFTVTHEETTLVLTGAVRIANGTPAQLFGFLVEDGRTSIVGRSVIFTLGSGATAQTCTGVTDNLGQVNCTIASVNQPLDASATVGVTAVFPGNAFYQPASASGVTPLGFLTGRAFGVSTIINLPSLNRRVAPAPDTGTVRVADAGSLTPPCAAHEGALAAINADVLCTNVTTSVAPGTSAATSSVDHISIAIPELPVITATAIKTRSTTTCAATNGATTITNLAIGGQPVNTNVDPNTTIAIAGQAQLVINEQIPVFPSADNGLIVNGLHLTGLDGAVDVVIASVTSTANNCFDIAAVRKNPTSTGRAQ